MRAALLACLLALLPPAAAAAPAEGAAPLSSQSADCLDCHRTVSPGIVEDWATSRHATTTPAQALALPEARRRMSAKEAPAGAKDVVVGCFECHGRNVEAHADAFDHFGFRINIVVSPRDCAGCHPEEATQYEGSKKAHALDNLRSNPLFHTFAETVNATADLGEKGLVHVAASDPAKNTTCYACHGSEVKVVGTRTVETDLGPAELPVLSNWPNQGVGRLNPDGSKGSCAACHARHAFSIEVARKPYTCRQCHLQPDVPAWDVYIESKHGNIFQSLGDRWSWSEVPWRVGKDFTAPTCAACHVSELATPDGDVIVERSHDFGSRLWVRLFGLPYSHPQPKGGATHGIRNADGAPLPVTFGGKLASEHLISAEEQARRKDLMARVCTSCHGSTWTKGHFDQLDAILGETDRMVLAGTGLVQKLWDARLADPANPFDESLERDWVELWFFHANSIRYAAAMGGPDYAAFKSGRWELGKGLRELEESVERALAERRPTPAAR